MALVSAVAAFLQGTGRVRLYYENSKAPLQFAAGESVRGVMRNRAISQVDFRFFSRVGRARLQRATLVGYAVREHFAAHEEPELLAEDLGSFFGDLRK